MFSDCVAPSEQHSFLPLRVSQIVIPKSFKLGESHLCFPGLLLETFSTYKPATRESCNSKARQALKQSDSFNYLTNYKIVCVCLSLSLSQTHKVVANARSR